MDAVRHVPVGIGEGRVMFMTTVRASERRFAEDATLVINLLRELDRAVHMPWLGERFDRAPCPRHERYACFGTWAVIRGDVFSASTARLLAACTSPGTLSVFVDSCAGVTADVPLGLYLLARFISGRPPCQADGPRTLPHVLIELCRAAAAQNTWLATQYFGAAVHLALTQAHAPWTDVMKHVQWAPECPFAEDAKRTRSTAVHMWNWLWQLTVATDAADGGTEEAPTLITSTAARHKLPAGTFLQLYALFQRLFESPQQPLLVHAQVLVWFGLFAAWLGPVAVLNDDADAADSRTIKADTDAAAKQPRLPAPALCGWLKQTPGRAIREFIAAVYSTWESTGANTALSSTSRLLVEEQMQLPNFVLARCAAVFAPVTRTVSEVSVLTADIAAIRF